ncbi:carbohydrate ABC transporter permease [Schleiferilactobacillus perolens]|jgi:multiple sugar transport system permease protein|uniref:N-acetyl-d-glucosamine abc transport system permease protein 2 n=1 Tax=Schleiferilactobacillus perolens DSM 12744 TaxID=1423792 RepID=A0A0R1N3D1_9LACO|nr:carbohydrate ABC transporter permease [Schleiferilactobacillus perolens]KRL14641.1 n-acetyl-d-glucosamine abc transport system permease protein 2 [Schleiferilactobacillus perolens DSM 12744]MCI1890665.1 carbohydrate ABC transporter permease [Schleiferilactobacillus harbinensis]MCI1914011.1 carbohydrate ABC transporter permease [Schleiferilactobacillus harbinensis]MCI2170019.1 carbohydrate ABC transporter permease [Schleiferilactobacillus perolens]
MKKRHPLVHVVLILGAVVMIVPFVWMILTSGKTLTESTQVPPTIFPKKFEWSNYSAVWALLPFGKFYLNTLLLVIGRVFFSVLTSAMAAYASARLRFPGRNLFFGLVLAQMMIPGQIFITPQYLLAQQLGIIDTVWGLILPGFVSAFGTFLLRQFFLTIPNELEEAAVLDGASIWTIFFKIMLPLVRSGLVALSIFTALFAFKDLMWPMIATTSVDKTTLSAGLANLQGQYATNFPQLMAGSLLAVWPMLVLFIIFQKKFIQGIATTGGKL